MNPVETDPVIDEVRETRRRISERFANDPAALVAYYVELQKQYKHRLAGNTKRDERSDPSAA